MAHRARKYGVPEIPGVRGPTGSQYLGGKDSIAASLSTRSAFCPQSVSVVDIAGRACMRITTMPPGCGVKSISIVLPQERRFMPTVAVTLFVSIEPGTAFIR